MVANSDSIVPMPFPFEHRQKRALLAFAFTKQTQDIALESGAEIAIGKDMVKKVSALHTHFRNCRTLIAQVLKGEFRTEDYDFCVALHCE